MSLLRLDLHPQPRALRVFGLATLVVCAILAWRLRGPAPPAAAAVAALGLAAGTLGLLAPRALRPLHAGLALAAWPVGAILSWLILLALYFLVLTPAGLILRLLGRDPLQRRIERGAPTYWIPCRRRDDPESWFRQF